MNYTYKFTVFTPCYNSEKLIHRVFESVQNQTFRNFEWLIINDASTDNTSKLLKEYQGKANFPIRIIDNESNKMLYHNFNLAFDEAEGELMVFAGHDDEFDSNTLEVFNEVWEEYGNEEISGITCMCRNQHGELIGIPFPNKVIVSNYHHMFEKYIYGAQERFGCTRTDILRVNKFDLNVKREGEEFLWSDIGKEYNTIFISTILRTYYNEETNNSALTKRTRAQVANQTFLYYIEFINIYIYFVPKASALKVRFHFALAFYRILAQANFFATLEKINSMQSKFLFVLFTPLAFALSIIKK